MLRTLGSAVQYRRVLVRNVSKKSGPEYQGHSLASIGAWKSVLGDNIKICPTVKNYCERRGAVFAAVLALLPGLIPGPPSCPCHINSHSTLTSSANTLSLSANTLSLSANTFSLSALEILFNFPHRHSPHWNRCCECLSDKQDDTSTRKIIHNPFQTEYC